MNILITGGLGYVGGRLADHLSVREPACKVTLGNVSVKVPAWAGKFRVLRLDVLEKASLAAAFGSGKIDAVVHLAAVNDLVCARDPELALDVNTKGTYNVLEAAAAAGVKRFVYFSTFHVYGPAAAGTITEATPAMPAHPYATTHRAAEDLVNYFRTYKGLKTLIFRLSNAFGCPMHKEVDTWTLVFNDLCRQLATTGSIILKSPGTQHRDFIPLGDVAEAVRRFLFDIPEKWGDGLFNLGGGGSISILEAARRIERVYEAKYGKKPGPLKAAPAAPGAPEPAPVDYSIRKLKAAGFTPVMDMDTEIDRTLQFCEQFKR